MKSPTLKGMEDNLFAIEDGYGKRKKKDFDKIPGLVFFNMMNLFFGPCL